MASCELYLSRGINYHDLFFFCLKFPMLYVCFNITNPLSSCWLKEKEYMPTSNCIICVNTQALTTWGRCLDGVGIYTHPFASVPTKPHSSLYHSRFLLEEVVNMRTSSCVGLCSFLTLAFVLFIVLYQCCHIIYRANKHAPLPVPPA